MNKIVLLAVLLSTWPLFPDAISAQPAAPVADQFQVNTYTTYRQRTEAVAASPGGDFLVVWENEVGAGNDEVAGRLYTSSGASIGGEFQLNSATAEDQVLPAAAFNSAGDFLAVWNSGESVPRLIGRVFDSAGTPRGDEFPVASCATCDILLSRTSVAAAPDGGWLAAWDSQDSPGNDTDSKSIQARWFDSDGLPSGDQFQVNTFTTDQQSWPRIAFSTSGDGLITWHNYVSQMGDWDYFVTARRFDSGGTFQDEFFAGEYTTGRQTSPDAVFGPDGSFLLTWAEGHHNFTEVFAQVFHSDGSRLGAQFQVNTYTTYNQLLPSAATDPSGDFLVVWQGYGSGSDPGLGIHGRRLASDGSFVGQEFQVNSYAPYKTFLPRTERVSPGRFVVAWYGQNSPGTDDGYSVHARFVVFPVFADAFESGDSSAWSGVVP